MNSSEDNVGLFERRPELPTGAGADLAAQYIREVVHWIGVGFHPDTDFGDYVTTEGSRCFTPEQAQRLNLDLERAVQVLEEADLDIYEIGLDAQQRLLNSHFGQSK